MLAPGPGDRIALDDILEHPWFRRDLSPRLRAVNADLVCNPSSLDTAACQLGDAQLAGLVAQAAAGRVFECRPDDLLWGRGGLY